MKVKAFLMVVLVMASLLFGSTGPAAADGPHPWPMYMGNAQRTGASPYLGPQSGTVAWTVWTGEGRAQPVIGSDGTAYVNNYYLYAIDSDGNLKWKVETRGKLTSAIGPDGTIYAPGLTDYTDWWLGDALLAFDPTGTEKWSYPLPPISSPPAIGLDGVIYICAGFLLHAINPDGTLRWRNDDVSAFSVAIMMDGTILAWETQWLNAVNPDGTLRWRAYVNAAAPVLGPDSTIYMSSPTEGLTALNPDGTLKWSFRGGSYDWRWLSPLAIGPNGTVYYGWLDQLDAFDPSGRLLWRLSIGGHFDRNPAVDSDGTIYCAAGSGVVALNPDGTTKWVYDPGSAFGGFGGIAIGADGTLYANPLYGGLHAFRDLAPACLDTAIGTGTACFAPGHGIVEDLEALLVPANPPNGYTFPHGLFSFKVTGLATGQAVVVNVELPSPVPAGTKWWKYHDGQWHDYNIPITISGNTITITLTDGGVGDIDDVAGQITDPGGPGYPLSLGYTVGWETRPISKVAVMAPWIALLAVIVAGASLLVLRRRQA